MSVYVLRGMRWWWSGRALHVLLFQAERDWAYAQALKRDVADAPAKRFHAIKRLRRAADHARALASLCGALGDRCAPRTLLDTQAYWHSLDGTLAVEMQQWENALDALVRARALLAGLARSGNAEQTALCNARIEDVDPSIRYSAYNLGPCVCMCVCVSVGLSLSLPRPRTCLLALCAYGADEPCVRYVQAS
jgi:hypothetical protein